MKLVRDNIPKLYAEGKLKQRMGDPEEKKYKFRQVSDEERKMLLALKLSEELGEIISAPNREALVEELGDFIEVYGYLIASWGISLDEIEEAAKAKKERLGSFDNNWVIEWG